MHAKINIPLVMYVFMISFFCDTAGQFRKVEVLILVAIVHSSIMIVFSY